jgi:tetratricopeptide (TPR) repeat protein
MENDGTSTTDVAGRVKVQSQAGIQAFGLITFSYASATSDVGPITVRVLKPGGRVIETPDENFLDMPSEITREAPFYSDIKEKQVAVKGLEIGDEVEYQYREHSKKAIDPGQFWYAFNFISGAISLQEKLQVSVPLNRKVIVKSAKVQPVISEQGAYRVYSWNASNLKTAAEKKDDPPPDPNAPDGGDVQVTSFQNWDEVGQWFKGLAGPRAVPTPPVQARADELTRNAKTDQEKIQILYDYVSTKFRYIGIALGVGRYQPHTAEDVLSNDYGDCKDKHTLFAALLAAEKIKAYPVLAGLGATVDPEVPSPAQFNHLITAIPQGAGYLFLDTTPEVAPFGLLVPAIRDKQVLVIPDSGPAVLVKTPKEPPFKSTYTFQVDGALSDDGTWTSKGQITLRSDAEVDYRLAFRRAGESQYKDVMQRISAGLGFGGTVDDVTISPPDATDTPFHIEFSYTRKEFGGDWNNRRIVAPLPFISLPAVPEGIVGLLKPLEIGPPTVFVLRGSMRLPPGSNPNARAPLVVDEKFASFHSEYSVKNGTMYFDRRLTTKMEKISPDEYAAYKKFLKTIDDEEGRYISLRGEDDQPDDGDVSDEGQALFAKGAEAWQQRNLPEAVDDFQRAVAKDPNFSRAWMALGTMQIQLGDTDTGIASMQKAIALEPGQKSYYETLGPMLAHLGKRDDAIAMWRQLEKANPSDPDAPNAIGRILMDQKKYAAAIVELEAAQKRNPEDPSLQLMLGNAYILSGNKEKGVAALRAAAKKPEQLNNVAYSLADTGAALPEALEFSQKAVARLESDTAAIDLDHLEMKNIQTVPALAANWDTLGWVYFKMGQYDDAVRYLNAAWNLTQDAVIADHLGQAYAKQGKKQQAIVAYSRAIATGHAPAETEGRLSVLRGNVRHSPVEKIDVINLQEQRTVKLDKFAGKPAQHASAEFFILFAPGSKVAGVKFISGSEDLREPGKGLANAKLEAVFPDDHPSFIIRRGVLDCEPEVTGCVFVLIPPSAVQSVN